MRISAVNSNYSTINQRKLRENTTPTTTVETTSQAPTGMTMISFKSGNKGDVLHIIAELEPSFKTGGVATVGKDYKTLDNIAKNEHGRTVIFTPYYNGDITYDAESGELIKGVKVHKVPENLPEGHPLKGKEGKPFFTTKDLSQISKEELLKKESNIILLEEVVEKDMPWGLQEKAPIKLFKIPAEQAKCPKNTDIFFVYTEATASMTVPYQGGGYASSADALVKSWNGDPYAQFDKACVELMKDVDKKVSGFDPATVVCSDSHAAYTTHYMAQKNASGDAYFVGKKPTQVGHNLGDGYIGKTSPRNMIVNLGASKAELENLRNSKQYLEALMAGEEDKYLIEFLGKITNDKKKVVSAMDIPIYYGIKGYLPMFSTVSEGYHNATITNKEVAPALYDGLKQLNELGRYIGLTNPLNDPSITPYQPLGMPGYGKDQKYKLKNGEEVTIKAFQHIDSSKATDLNHVREVKRNNKINLLERFQDKFNGLQKIGENGALEKVQASENLLRSGLVDKNHEIYGSFNKAYIEQLKKGEDIKLITSWGRGDFQKGLDTVVDGFEKFVTKTGDKNTLLLLGGDLQISPEEGERVINRVKLLSQKEDFKGRIVLMDGFAPGLPFASASDVCVFPSRFAPCELTDLEAKRMLTTPIVTNCQGLAQKNFDPDIEADKKLMDAFKTKHDFYMTEKDCLADGVATSKAKEDFLKIKNKLVTEETNRLKNRLGKETVSEVEIYERLHKNNKYQKALRELKDSIISDEVAECLDKALIKYRNGDVAEQLLKNQVNIKTTWEENGWLSKTNLSAAELYRTKHIGATATDIAQQDLLKVDFSKITDVVSGGTKTGGGTTTTPPKEGNKIVEFFKSKTGKIALGVAAGVAIIGAGYHFFKKSKAPSSNAIAPTATNITKQAEGQAKNLSAVV